MSDRKDVDILRKAIEKFLKAYALAGFIGTKYLHQALVDTEPK